MADDDIYKQLRLKDEEAPKAADAIEKMGVQPFQKLVLKVSERFLRLHLDVKDVVDQNFRDIVKAGIGIDNSWGEARLNRTNGFRSQLSSMIERLAREYIAKDAAKVFDEIVLNEKKFSVDLKKAFLETFRDSYYQALQAELKTLIAGKRAEVTKGLEEDARAFVSSLDKTIGPVLEAEIRLAQNELMSQIEAGRTDGI